MRQCQFQIKRVYEAAQTTDGERILVDRLWPRGLSKEKARVDLWLKESAPSHALRKWFSHKEERWQEFRKRYFKELEGNNKEEIRLLLSLCRKNKITLLYSAKDEKRNNAVALKDFLGA